MESTHIVTCYVLCIACPNPKHVSPEFNGVYIQLSVQRIVGLKK